ncbi:hypothetical protein VTI74DRAFT_431 [Chaetomium olivicolor]
MCFGNKNEASDEQVPRPAQNHQSDQKRASVPAQYNNNNNHQQSQHQQTSNEYAPPPGPPPSHRPPVSSGGDDFAPPPGPPPSQRLHAGGDDFAPPPGPPPSHAAAANDFAPPPGPPPSHRAPAGNDYAPPPGPPPSHLASNDYAPPPGPPPSHRPQEDMSYIAPPPGSPPSQRAHDDLSYVAPPPGPPPAENRPKHDWETVVPDTSLFPPPPSFFSGWDRSPAHNATEEEAVAGEAWCAQHPLTGPITLDAPALAALNAHNPRLMQPQNFRGTLVCKAPGLWAGQTDSHATDSTIIAYPPLYTVTVHSPLSPTNTARSKTIYYEVQLTPTHNPRSEICVALGFTALPYPSFRMPGWHRGSLAVHGDDGHKFINDRWGGKSFTAPFVRGERYGIGMVFREAGGRIDTEVFFTRQGREVGRWNLHEETDAEQDLPVTGLEGYHDLSCAIGTSGETGWEVVLDPARWLYRPVGI